MVHIESSRRLFRIVFLLGPPGSGKGQVGKALESCFGVPWFSCGDLLRNEVQNMNMTSSSRYERCKLIRDTINKGQIVPSNITIELMLDKMQELFESKNSDIFVIDGFPRNFENYQNFMEMSKNKAEILKVLYLKCPEEVSFERCYQRGKTAEACGSTKRDDDTEDVIRNRIRNDWINTERVYQTLKDQNLLEIINSDQPLKLMNEDACRVFGDLLRSIKENSMKDIASNNTLTT